MSSESDLDTANASSAYGAVELDAVDRVVEVADMMAVFAADRLVRVDALRLEACAEAERFGRGLTGVVERSVRLELAAALRITEHAAGDLMAAAEALVHRYPAALASLGRARMTERHAQILVGELDVASPATRDAVLGRAVALAEEQPVGSFRRMLKKLIAAEESVTLAQRHAEALTRRRVVVEHVEDGMAWLHALIPSVEAHAILGRATAIAKVLAAEECEERTRDQLRADALCDLLIEGEATAHPASARGIRATVNVTVPVLSLLDEEATGPAVVEGVGPIPRERARELCGGAEGWTRILTHPETGMVLSVGREQYRPPEALRRLVRWRADRCMAPGCGMPASRCEIDHTLAWDHGGDTSLGNLAPLCKGHHTVKHHGGWTVRQIDDSGGAIEWTSPTGRRYLVRPERPVPVFRAA
ncbi:HNH endonuclease signature motif containing protein [Microbacterium sp. RU33B]|uniref:HNH endonuclease signature motif containing protein n=1 Tax=Microbacterium sp. RU33B TaxID=1907390 RepID=UPI000963CA54|nr:HNH endonuclease signature motif containing protein [Microbacterium sp. RU33B]SIT82907.1 HNH endonuclease [Microbacterium sp. RU33B]